MAGQWLAGWQAVGVVTWQRVFVASGAIGWAVGLACAGAAGLLGARLVHGRMQAGAWSLAPVRPVMPGVLAIAAGVATIACGYLPLLPTAMSIAVNGVAARINAAAVPGAAGILAGLLWVWCFALPLSRRSSRLLFGVALAFLIAATALHTIRLGNAMNSITDHHPCSNPRYHLPCSVTGTVPTAPPARSAR